MRKRVIFRKKVFYFIFYFRASVKIFIGTIRKSGLTANTRNPLSVGISSGCDIIITKFDGS